MTVVGLLFSFSGRINRTQYAIAVAVQILAVFAGGIALYASIGGTPADIGVRLHRMLLSGSAGSIAMTLLLAMTLYAWSAFAMMAKRLHDMGLSAKFIWLYVALVVAVLLVSSDSALLEYVNYAVLAVFIAIPGVAERNIHGDVPTGRWFGIASNEDAGDFAAAPARAATREAHWNRAISPSNTRKQVRSVDTGAPRPRASRAPAVERVPSGFGHRGYRPRNA